MKFAKFLKTSHFTEYLRTTVNVTPGITVCITYSVLGLLLGKVRNLEVTSNEVLEKCFQIPKGIFLLIFAPKRIFEVDFRNLFRTVCDPSLYSLLSRKLRSLLKQLRKRELDVYQRDFASICETS